MKKRKLRMKLLSFLLTLAMVMGLMPGMNFTAYADTVNHLETNAGETSIQPLSATASKNTISKYGNVVLSLKCEDLLSKGYEYGDILSIRFLERSLELPLCSNFTDVDSGSPGIFAKKDQENVMLAINMGDFATYYGIAQKQVDENNQVLWTMIADEEISVTISMKEKGGYYAEYLLHQLKYEDDRSAYPELTDEQFANFRAVTTTGMGKGVLYRSASPINPLHNRNTYADAAIRKAGVNVIMNLADDEATARGYEGFGNSYYSRQKFITLNLGIDFAAVDFQQGLSNGLRFFALNHGIYEIHCTEGKDRAGFVSAILECLMGASYDEVISDYMVTYYNYYGVTRGDERYQTIAESNIVKSLQRAFAVENLKSADLAAEAEEYIKQIGLSDEEIALLKVHLAKNVETVTKQNPDGSTTTTTTTTDSEGTKTTESETVKADGTVEKSTDTIKADGSTEKSTEKIKPNGSSEKVTDITKPNGATIHEEVKTTAKGKETSQKIETSASGSVKITEQVKQPSGDHSKVVMDKTGKKTVAIKQAVTTAKNGKVTIPKTVNANGEKLKVTSLKKNFLKGSKTKPKKITINASNITKVAKGAFNYINKKAVIKIVADKKDYKRIQKLIKKSGVGKDIKIKRVK
ncbi:MAG: tyrosine-protein phosphatase [Eubacterium sp.]|nr:tyrosine-protein phosphatase [Eubacterium sp.]